MAYQQFNKITVAVVALYTLCSCQFALCNTSIVKFYNIGVLYLPPRALYVAVLDMHLFVVRQDSHLSLFVGHLLVVFVQVES